MTDIVIILVLVLLNGVLAMSELAVVSARRMRVDTCARGPAINPLSIALRMSTSA